MSLGESLDDLLNELDSYGTDKHGELPALDEWVCRRKLPRHIFRTACTVTFVQPGVSEPSRLPGRTRNLSRNGLAVLVRRPFHNGDAIEVELVVPERPRTFVAGGVTFCRYAGQGYYELGIELKFAANRPILTVSPVPNEHCKTRLIIAPRK